MQSFSPDFQTTLHRMIPSTSAAFTDRKDDINNHSREERCYFAEYTSPSPPFFSSRFFLYPSASHLHLSRTLMADSKKPHRHVTRAVRSAGFCASHEA